MSNYNLAMGRNAAAVSALSRKPVSKPVAVHAELQPIGKATADVVNMPAPTLAPPPAAIEIPEPAFSNAITAETMLKDARCLGEAEGAGLNSRHELAMIVAEGCTSDVGAIKPGADVHAMWLAYTNGNRAEALSPEQTKEKSFQVQVSKLNAVAKFGAHPKVDAMIVLGRTKSIAVELRASDETKVSIFDALVKVSRAHATLEQPMTDDEIRTALMPTGVTDDKTEVKELEHMIAAMRKMEKTFASVPLADAIGKLEVRLEALLPKAKMTPAKK